MNLWLELRRSQENGELMVAATEGNQENDELMVETTENRIKKTVNSYG